mgnify:CR=1 FL=1
MTEKKLSTGRKVLIRNLSRLEMRECRSFVKERLYPDGSKVTEGVFESFDAWIDKAVAGLDDWKAKNGEVIPDEIMKRLNEKEQAELVLLIQETQVLNPKKPSGSV